MFMLISLFWLLNVGGICATSKYIRRFIIQQVIFPSLATDVDALIVKILLKLMFLLAAVLRTRSIYDFQLIVRLRMLLI